MSFTLMFSVALVVVLSIAFKALGMRPSRSWRQIRASIGRFWVSLFTDKSNPTEDLSPADYGTETYISCLLHQLELTKTLQRVMTKTSQSPGSQAVSREKLQNSLELRMAVLITEINAQESMVGSNNTDARPDWKRLQRGFGHILALHQKRFTPSNVVDAQHQDELESDQSGCDDISPLEKAAQNCTREIAELNEQLSNEQHRLGESDKRVKLLETKLSLAQKKIACLQWHIEQPDQEIKHAIDTTPMKQSG